MGRSTTRHDTIDYKPIIKRIANINPYSEVRAEGYPIENTHPLDRE
jgi:hypothetical protein